jgi:gliding motility-associated-like protein
LQTTPAVTTTYKLKTVTDVNGCVFDATNPANTLDNQVTIRLYTTFNVSFNEGTVPPFVGGSSTVTFTNTSSPLDGNVFEYAWDFDLKSNLTSNPISSDQINPAPVVYNTPGPHDVVLTVTNKQARADGLECVKTFSKTIFIDTPPLNAAFKVTPLASCFPTKLTVENQSPGADVFEWKLLDGTGKTITTSNLVNPVFEINNPGTYDVFLTAKSSFTAQTAFSQKNGIEVLAKPSAVFQARPTTLYVPDTELQVFNFSTNANLYLWDFNDGRTTTEFEPKHHYDLEGKYFVTLVAGYDYGQRDVDGDGIMDGNIICYDTARQQIIALDGGFIKLPNAFTPNINGSTGGSGTPGNGTFNDVFLPVLKGVVEFTMQVYDRWGTLVFESRDKDTGWDGYDRNGRLMPAGVYVYKLVLRLSNGERTTKVGDITLIR